MESSQPTRYRAFVSYSHVDKKWGDWLHKVLETYRVPKSLIGQPSRTGPVPKRLYPVFRDREVFDVNYFVRSATTKMAGR